MKRADELWGIAATCGFISFATPANAGSSNDGIAKAGEAARNWPPGTRNQSLDVDGQRREPRTRPWLREERSEGQCELGRI